jgi:hypothetical protein
MSDEQIRAAALHAATQLDLSTEVRNHSDRGNEEIITRTLNAAKKFEDFIRHGKTE